LYLSSTIAAGSNSIIASSKYVSKDGRKSLSLDLHASRLFGHKFHNLVSSGLLKNNVNLIIQSYTQMLIHFFIFKGYLLSHVIFANRLCISNYITDTSSWSFWFSRFFITDDIRCRSFEWRATFILPRVPMFFAFQDVLYGLRKRRTVGRCFGQ